MLRLESDGRGIRARQRSSRSRQGGPSIAEQTSRAGFAVGTTRAAAIEIWPCRSTIIGVIIRISIRISIRITIIGEWGIRGSMHLHVRQTTSARVVDQRRCVCVCALLLLLLLAPLLDRVGRIGLLLNSICAIRCFLPRVFMLRMRDA